MPKYVIYCVQDTTPTISAEGALVCDGGVSALQVGSIDAGAATPDPAAVSAVWGAAFTSVLLCFFIARMVGAVLIMIREG